MDLVKEITEKDLLKNYRNSKLVRELYVFIAQNNLREKAYTILKHSIKIKKQQMEAQKRRSLRGGNIVN